MSGQEDLVSVIVRTTPGRERECLRALRGIAANDYGTLEILVVYQGANESINAPALQNAAGKLPLRVLCNPADKDERARNLNLGWAAARGRYIAFLDDDDDVGVDHYSCLIRALREDKRAWAYSRTALRREDANFCVLNETYPFDRPRFSLIELWRQNFIPIHSILIDRSRLPEELSAAPFCEELTRSEDWDFLLRLAYFREPIYVNRLTCYYHVSTERPNTNQSIRVSEVDAVSAQRDAAEWARCKVMVMARRERLIGSNWWAREYFAGAA
jgi:glycosyltransferase involved in cell wall biosynthesis